MPTNTNAYPPFLKKEGTHWYSRVQASALAVLTLLIFLALSTPYAFAGKEKKAPNEQKASGLEFRAVHPNNTILALQVEAGETPCPPEYELLEEYERDGDGNLAKGPKGLFVTHPILVAREVIVTGSEIQEASPDFSRPGVMNILLTEKGGKAMAAYTANIVPGRDRMAHVLNGKVISAPSFQTKNLGKHFIITGIPGGTNEVKKLCDRIMAGKNNEQSK